MAKKVQRKNIRKSKKVQAQQSPFKIYWEKQNYLFLSLGFIVIIIGFYLMTIGPWDSVPSLVISPILLFIGYVLIFPASILSRKKKGKDVKQEEQVDSGKS